MTRDDLRGIIEGITDEQLKKILDINSADIGRAKAMEEQLKTSLQEAESQISALKESQREAEKVKMKYEELQKAADQRAEEDKIASLESRFQAASNNAEFLNSFTREGVFSRFVQELEREENSKKSDSEIFAQVTEGEETVFASQNEIPMVVASTSGFGGDLTDGDIREIMGLNP